MIRKILVFLGLSLLTWPLAWADDDNDARFPRDATFTTLITTPLAIEGLTGDDQGNLYTTGRGADPCPVWRISLANPARVTVGNVPAPCAPSGITFGSDGDLFISNNDTIFRLTPNAANPSTASPYATGVPGTNGLAFDRDGNLWTGDGTTGQGRVWKIPPHTGPVAGIEMMPPSPSKNASPIAGPSGIGSRKRCPSIQP